MPVELVQLVGLVCIGLVVRAIYRGLGPADRGDEKVVDAVLSLVAGVPLGAFVALWPVLLLSLVLGPIQ